MTEQELRPLQQCIKLCTLMAHFDARLVMYTTLGVDSLNSSIVLSSSAVSRGRAAAGSGLPSSVDAATAKAAKTAMSCCCRVGEAASLESACADPAARVRRCGGLRCCLKEALDETAWLLLDAGG